MSQHMQFRCSDLLHMCESLINTRDNISCRARGLKLSLRLLGNGIARRLKRFRTSKGDYCIKQRFSTITSLFKMGTAPKGKNLLPLGANSFL